jgi:KipI family sensor histidine kinase inhibitor
MPPPRIQYLGDAALLVTFGDEFSEAVNEKVMRAAASLRDEPLSASAADIVPGISSLALHFSAEAPLDSIANELRARLESLPSTGHDAWDAAERVHDIQVRYGGDDGPDLGDVAAFAGISESDVIERHAARTYRVYMLGFLPGFAYLGQVDRTIAAPRRSSPRQAVPAGSVGIAGLQTGVYPQVSPGGWQLIGRTTAAMFDTAAGRSRLQPGERVRFVPERST